MDYIQVGKIINTQGIKGEVKIHPLTDDISRFDELEKVYIGEEKVLVYIEKNWSKKEFVILKFVGYDDINEVLKFKNEYLYIEEKDKIKLEEDSYFIFDIVGCNVLDIKGNKIGIVTQVITNTGNDIYIIKSEDNSKNYLIPAVKQFIKKVDIKNKEIIIEPIEGLIE
ncbi:ribosome maturation factor RimM [Anaerosalibacter bizertensis]|uniref:Ribosome maturation factor RimM n=1 Tax=Anaerosalibacter bizertensis TaxID=932217 RepID=A0A9Q4AAH7_9FIRM|nr:ribosome maturation factor RimM [Anaerosalibacter bizertensis]MBV1816573.1 ribosome maturation factor RimM [Bacteroidales bacterium MSK.15.36]MCB5558623.1 ribosome maturation factor RimM [Anaerosalibacter bizertensis]MCG4563960.1 ribosome maturation factor RimM [Anaerosalibacter bizertensis]MCG4581915.1 ribosome maturation factor RimM [Anaerosalibacter bizertensis]